MKTIELLAPAGSYEALIASIQGGADAVYLSGSQFGARQFANNFDKEEMVQAIIYAHIRGVKVYVTVNTLIKDREWAAVTAYVDFLYLNDVDGIIVQDLGLAAYIKKHYPDVELHASTQMSCHHLNDFIFLKSFGFDRVVAGREMTLDQLKAVKDQLDLEIEVFVHGALCVCYSGQCLMSSVIGGRSGNRGRCAQPCRQVYDFDDKSSYTLSPKDLNAIDHLDQLRAIGVDSLKIEGRMKGPEYAWTVVKAYKNKLLGLRETDHLNQIFHRPYTGGLLLEDKDWVCDEASGNRGEFIGTVKAYDSKTKRLTLLMHKTLSKGDEIQIRQKNTSVGARVDIFYLNNARVTTYKISDDIEVPFKYKVHKGEEIYRTYDALWMKEARNSYQKNVQTIDISMAMTLKLDQVMTLVVKDQAGHEIRVTSTVCPEKALNKALDENRVLTQLNKLGATPYKLKDYTLDLQAGLAVSVKAINELRRSAIDLLDKKRQVTYKRQSKNLAKESLESRPRVMPKISVSVLNQAQRDALEGLAIDTIYFDNDTPMLPRISSQAIDQSYGTYHGTMMLSNYGQVGLYGQQGWHGNFSLNVFNSHSLEVYKQMNCQRMTLSYELSKTEIKALKSNLDLTLIVYGRVPVMVSRYCPVIKKTMACDKCPDLCKDHPGLTDRFNAVYPLMKGPQAMTILSHKPLHLMPHLKDFLPGPVGHFHLDFTLETPEEVRRITQGYLTFIATKEDTLALDHVMDYHFLKGVE